MDKIMFVIGFVGGVLILSGIILQSAEILSFMVGFLIALIVVSLILGREHAGDNASSSRDSERRDFGGEYLG